MMISTAKITAMVSKYTFPVCLAWDHSGFNRSSDSRMPRGPVGPRTPQRPPGGDLGRGGAVFDDNFRARNRTAPVPSQQPLSNDMPAPPASPGLARATTPTSVHDAMRRSPLPRLSSRRPAFMHGANGNRQHPGAMPFASPRADMQGPWPSQPFDGNTSMGMGAAPPYTSGLGGAGPSRAFRPEMGGRRVSFDPEAPLARPREDETNREPDAGAPLGPKDIQ